MRDRIARTCALVPVGRQVLAAHPAVAGAYVASTISLISLLIDAYSLITAIARLRG